MRKRNLGAKNLNIIKEDIKLNFLHYVSEEGYTIIYRLLYGIFIYEDFIKIWVKYICYVHARDSIREIINSQVPTLKF